MSKDVLARENAELRHLLRLRPDGAVGPSRIPWFSHGCFSHAEGADCGVCAVLAKGAGQAAHRCAEACLHDCPECGHEVDHGSRFHAPGCWVGGAPSAPSPAIDRERLAEAREFADRAAALARTATEPDAAIQAYALTSIALSLSRREYRLAGAAERVLRVLNDSGSYESMEAVAEAVLAALAQPAPAEGPVDERPRDARDERRLRELGVWDESGTGR